MQILRWIRMLLTVCGCMRPSSWSSPTRRFFYNLYTVFVLIMVYTVVLSEILDAVLVVDNTDDFSDNIFMTVAIIVSCYKILYFLINRETFKILIDTLSRKPFLPKNKEENEIRDKFDKLSELNAFVYTILVEMCASFLWVSALITDFKNRKLTFRAWIPYNYCSLFPFIITFCHQVIGMVFACLLNATFDILFGSLLIHTSCQLEILGYRLNNITKDGYKSAKQCVRHHESIYKFATMVNEGFKSILGVQFGASFLIICFSLFRLTQKELGMQFIETLLYMFCVTMEILYYCWYGNEVKLKSLEIPDVIFTSNWTSLSANTKRILLMIMRRAMLLKTSYSAYNLLKNTRN